MKQWEQTTAARRFWRAVFGAGEELRNCSSIQQQSSQTALLQGLTINQIKTAVAVEYLTRDNPSGVRLKVLAERLHLSNAATSEMVELLVRKKVLLRTVCSEDRRAVQICLSPEISRVFQRGETIFDRAAADFLDTLPQDEQLKLCAHLEAFTAMVARKIEDKNMQE